MIPAGAEHACGVFVTGITFCPVPTLVPGIGPAASLSLFRGRVCAVGQAGDVLCWPRASVRRSGTGRLSEHAPAPEPVPGPAPFAVVAAGNEHACGLTRDGDVYCWGRGVAGQLGNGDVANQDIPQKVDSPARFVAISAGSSHTCGITVEAAAYCWGFGATGALGTGQLTNETRPAAVQ